MENGKTMPQCNNVGHDGKFHGGGGGE